MESRLHCPKSGKCEKFDKWCRICLTENIVQSNCLHEAHPGGLSVSLASMVMELARVEIHRQDALPDIICGDCLGELDAAHSFRLKCERSDGLLRRLHSDWQDKASPQTNRGDQSHLGNVKSEETISQFVKTECDIDFNNDLLSDNDFFDSETVLIKDKSLTVKTEIEDDINYCSEKKRVKHCGPFICDLCNRPMSSLRSLENHKLRMHSEARRLRMGNMTGYGANKRFHCPECPYSTPYHKTMRNHVRTHTGERPFLCSLCPASFAQPGTLKAHVTRHSDVMHFTCPICGKQFKLKDLYESHKLVHSDVKAHSCSICSKGFKTKKSLAIHIKRHLNIRDFSCHECGATFVCASSLMNHSKSHITVKNFECHSCGLKTKTKSLLVDHMRLHTSERSYKCQLCDYSAISRSTIKVHMRKHTREKNYSCPICHLKMVYSSSVNRHMFKFHGVHYKVRDHTDRRLIK